MSDRVCLLVEEKIAEALRYRIITLVVEDILKGNRLAEREVDIPPSNCQWLVGDCG